MEENRKPLMVDLNDENEEMDSIEKEKIEAEKRLEAIMAKKKFVKPLIVDLKDPGNTKPFLVLLKGTDEDGVEFAEWSVCIGRQEAYDYIKSFLGMADLAESYIIAEDDAVKDKKRVIDFLIYVIEQGKIEDPGFDPMDYIEGDLEEEDN